MKIQPPNPHQPMQKLKPQMMPLGVVYNWMALGVVYNWLFVNFILMLSTDVVRFL